MLTEIQAGGLTLRGISLGGIYTSIQVPELHLVLDAGWPLRGAAGSRRLLLSHGHVDHSGALSSLLGIRALFGNQKPLVIYLPDEITEEMTSALRAMSAMQRYELNVELVGMKPGDEAQLSGDLRVRALRTYHPVPSLAYLIIRTIQKLRPEYAGLPGPEIAALRKAGQQITDATDRLELGYATDTLVDVLDREPDLLRARTLILECTFLNDRKPLKAARAGCHIHLDELIERAEAFRNDHVVLMHFSQLYSPQQVIAILGERLPAGLKERVIPFVPRGRTWP